MSRTLYRLPLQARRVPADRWRGWRDLPRLLVGHDVAVALQVASSTEP
jgi:hypothetical protein